MAYKLTWNAFFDLYDTDKSGDVSPEDVKGAARYFIEKYNISKDSPDYEKAIKCYDDFFGGFFKATDTNKNGKVTREELINTMTKIKEAGYENAPAWWRDGGESHFGVVDKNKTGEISLEELTEFVKKERPAYTDADIEHAYKWGLQTVGREKLDKEAYFHLNYIWGTDTEPHHELDIIFPFWSKTPVM
eukprot:Phypoly_transcript_16057.p1 GENE.Phypoly_transcript_16057~~Phypoly_transcript_16057.p1  ORF type:complete len:189 (+),score=41.26 Phypoly_transcript_16057:97-663(+)